MSKLLIDDNQQIHKIGSFLRKKSMMQKNYLSGIQAITNVNGERSLIRM